MAVPWEDPVDGDGPLQLCTIPAALHGGKARREAGTPLPMLALREQAV